jgi:hypothetical protein
MWISVDPAHQDIFSYGYCKGNPVILVDKDGRWWWLVGAAVGAVAGGLIGGATDGDSHTWWSWQRAGIGAAVGFVIGAGVDIYQYYHPTGDAVLNDMNFRKDVDNFYKTKIDGVSNPDRYVEHATDVYQNEAGSYSMGDIRNAPYDNPGHTPFNPSSAAKGSFHYQQPTASFPTNGTLDPSVADKSIYKAILNNSGGDYNYISNLSSVRRFYADGTFATFNNLNAIRNTSMLNAFFMW